LEVMHRGIEAGAVFVPGAAFTPVEGTHSTLRLAYSFVAAEKLVEGVRRLAPAGAHDDVGPARLPGVRPLPRAREIVYDLDHDAEHTGSHAHR
ncbi:UNVERIFIED_CONTAM: hypothetical protein NY603_22345, partial [Bacteroidetes bacterium 56_B9]